jgi:hypothetical protein
LREKIHHAKPPITRTVTPSIKPRLDPTDDSVAVTDGVTVGGVGVMEGEGVGRIEVGVGVNVAVTGGATNSTNFCSGRITEAAFKPFQAIRSASCISYRLAIQESVSPLRTV